MEDNEPGAPVRRRRSRARTHLRDAQFALDESARLARAGDIAMAERAARLAERHAKLAAQLTDLRMSLTRIATARIKAERALDETFAAREAAIALRGAALQPAALPERTDENRQAQEHHAGADPHFRATLARLRGEPEG